MKRSAKQHNVGLLRHVAQRFEELCDEITFVGGCIAALLITDKAAPDVRFTVDIDCIINVVTLSDYYKFAKKLREKGFRERLYGDDPICRWSCDGVLVDVMPINKDVFGFSNQWYKEALSNAIIQEIDNSLKVRIISAPYFLAKKIEAFKDRGDQDFLLSHDLEDIISLIDGRKEIIDDLRNVSSPLKKYLSMEFSYLVANSQFSSALPGHLNYSLELESRVKIVKERIEAIINCDSAEKVGN